MSANSRSRRRTEPAASAMLRGLLADDAQGSVDEQNRAPETYCQGALEGR